MDSIVRLTNEFKNIQKKIKFGCYARPKVEKKKLNYYLWDCQLYKNGYFYPFTLSFAKDYPITPPLVKFTTKVFNPNVYSSGQVCLDLIGDKWQPSYNISDIFNALSQLIDHPNPNSPANDKAAKLYLKEKKHYEEMKKSIDEKNNKKYKIIDYLIK